MSLTVEERLRVLLSSSPPAQREIPVVTISHSALSRSFAFWPEPYPGRVATSDGSLDVLYAPMQIELAGSEANLDQEYQLTLDTTDVQDAFRNELDRIPLNTTERVRLTFYSFVSSDLTQEQARAPLEAESIAFEIGTATITAVSPRYNVLSTGEVYAPRDVPMLRGFT